MPAERRRTCEAGRHGGLQRTRTPMARRQARWTCGGRLPTDLVADLGGRRQIRVIGTNGCQCCGRRRGPAFYHRHVIMNPPPGPMESTCAQDPETGAVRDGHRPPGCGYRPWQCQVKRVIRSGLAAAPVESGHGMVRTVPRDLAVRLAVKPHQCIAQPGRQRGPKPSRRGLATRTALTQPGSDSGG